MRTPGVRQLRGQAAWWALCRRAGCLLSPQGDARLAPGLSRPPPGGTEPPKEEPGDVRCLQQEPSRAGMHVPGAPKRAGLRKEGKGRTVEAASPQLSALALCLHDFSPLLFPQSFSLAVSAGPPGRLGLWTGGSPPRRCGGPGVAGAGHPQMCPGQSSADQLRRLPVSCEAVVQESA